MFTVPDEKDVTSGDQADLDNVDLQILAGQGFPTGVVSGCAVTAQGTPNMTVHVASGTVRVSNTDVAVSAGDVTITTADASNRRYDLIVVNGAGTKSAIAGTPAAAPVFPSVDLSVYVVLAAVRVAAIAGSIATTDIIRKDAPVPPYPSHPKLHAADHAPGGADPVSGSSSDFPANFALSGDITPAALSVTNTDDYDPGAGFSTASTLRLSTNNTAQRNINGLVGGADGRILLLHNLGPGPLGLVDEAVTSTAANRFALAGDIVLPVDRSVLLQYDSTAARWRVISGATGAATPAPVFAATAAAGVAPYFLRSDDQLALFDTTVPSASTALAATGSVAKAARRDHQHGNSVSVNGLRSDDDLFYVLNQNDGTPMGRLSIRRNGSASVVGTEATGTASHPGVISVEPGTTTTGRAGLMTGVAAIVFGGGRSRCGCWLKTPANLSDGTDRYEIMAGFFDSTSAAPTDGAFIHYRDDVNSGKWECKTIANSVASTADSGVTMVVSTWYLLEVEVNAAGNSVTFYINGSSVGTITTNIPTGAGRETGFGFVIVKSLGNTNRPMTADAWYLELDFTTAR